MFRFFQMKSRSSFYTILLNISLLVCLSVCASATIVIDDFVTSQELEPHTGGRVQGAGIIGGERDAYTGYYSSAYMDNIVPGQLYFEAGSMSYNEMVLVYDGVDGATSTDNYSGLKHVDLTVGKTCNGFVFNFTQVPAYWVDISMELRQGEDKYGYGYTSVVNLAQAVFLPFADFVSESPSSTPPVGVFASYAPPTLIDFADVGYIRIRLVINGADETCTLDSIGTGYVAPEPATLLLLGLGGLAVIKRKHRIV